MASKFSAIEFRKVSKRFGQIKAVDQVDVQIKEGEFFSILGPSGSGKTTCLRLIAGLEVPDQGQILMGSEDVSRLPANRRHVNTVFQNYALFPNMSVGENIGYGLKIRKVAPAERRVQVEEILELVQLSDVYEKKPNQLSGGQAQRVALARALINQPKILLLDEPLGALDLKLRQTMQLELKRIQRQVGITFVYVTHDQGEALSMSDRLGIFHRGKFEQIGTPETVYDFPQSIFSARFVGNSAKISSEWATKIIGQPRSFFLRPEHIQMRKKAKSKKISAGSKKKSSEKKTSSGVSSLTMFSANQFQIAGIVRIRFFSGTHVCYHVQPILPDEPQTKSSKATKPSKKLESPPVKTSEFIEVYIFGDFSEKIEVEDSVWLTWETQHMRFLKEPANG